MSRILRTKTVSVPKNEMIIRKYEKFNFTELTKTEKFLRNDMYKVIAIDQEFDISYIKEDSCDVPVLFECHPSKLGIQDNERNYNDYQIVAANCSPSITINVVVNGKRGTSPMKLSELLKLFSLDVEKRKHILKYLPLDYTFTDLSNIFKCPNFAREFDLAVNNWPDIYKVLQLEYVNDDGSFKDKIIPMTLNYCSFSAKGEFTDFQTNVGGTCGWVTMLFGSKTWWIIPPTDHNIAMFEQYLKDPSSKKDFLGDSAKDCCRITLTAGQSFYLPAGYIHAVLTNNDSLIIGGNFLTYSSLDSHLKIAQSEGRRMVKGDCIYPNFLELMWYTVASIVYEATEISYIDHLKYQSLNNVKNYLLENPEQFYSRNVNKFKFIAPFLKNATDDFKTAMAIPTINNPFKYNSTVAVIFVNREKFENWTINEVKGFRSLLHFIEKNKKRMEKYVPIEITEVDKMLEAYEQIVCIACKVKNIVVNLKEEVPAHTSWIKTLNEKATIARKRKLAKIKEKKEIFKRTVANKRYV